MPLTRAHLLLEKTGRPHLPVREGGRDIGILRRADIKRGALGGVRSSPPVVRDLMSAAPPALLRALAYSVRSYEQPFLEEAAREGGLELHCTETRLDARSASLAEGFDVVAAFVNDSLDSTTLEALRGRGVRGVALRSAGYNHLDLVTLKRLGLRAARVPAYSPNAVSEHALALLLTLLRKTHKAYNRVREGNFSLDGLVGGEIRGKTVGVLGTGKIGRAFAKAMRGLDARVLACDPYPSKELGPVGVEYVELSRLFEESDVLSLHCPLTPESRHVINEKALSSMKPGVILINTSRGGLIDSAALLKHLKRGRIGALGLDVYEQEEGVFFEDHSASALEDDLLARLLTFPNVLITGHQGFLTDTALGEIARATALNCASLGRDGPPGPNELTGP
jgi:D-lactate dehydrogenase